MSKEPFDIFGLHGGSPLTGDYASFAAEIGNVIWAWNHLHGSLADNFCLLSGISDPVYPRAIWNSIKSDVGQRDVLRGLAISHQEKRPYGPLDFTRRQFFHAIDEIVWMHSEIGNISAFRNDATHTLWSKEYQSLISVEDYQPPKAIPDTERGNPRGRRLIGRDAPSTFRALANYSFELAQYCRFIDAWILMWDDSATFRERPVRPPILRDRIPTQNLQNTDSK